MNNEFKLRNGTILLSTEAPGGIYNAAQLKKIAQLCEGEVAIVKATEDQRLALCVKPEKASQVAKELKALGIGVRHYQDGLHAPTSCIGALCPDNEQDALGTSMEVSEELDALKTKAPLKIGINGCAKCCVPCHTLDVSVIGDANGYRVSLGGKNSQIPEMASFIAEGVPADELPKLVRQVVEIYNDKSEEGESLQSLIERVGATEFIAAFAPYSQDAAAGSSDPFDTATTPASLGAGTEEQTEEVPVDESLESISELMPEDTLDGALDANLQDSLEVSLEDKSDGHDSNILSEDDSALAELASGPDESIPDIEIASNLQAGNDLSEVAISHDADSLNDEVSLEGSGSLDLSDDLSLLESPGDVASVEEASTEIMTLEDADLAEAKIDVSDVLTSKKGSEVAADINADQSDLETIPDTSVDEAMVEQELSASIVAQEKLVDGVDTDDERLKTLDQLESDDLDLNSDLNADIQESTLDEGAVLEEISNDVSDEPSSDDDHLDSSDDVIVSSMEPEVITDSSLESEDDDLLLSDDVDVIDDEDITSNFESEPELLSDHIDDSSELDDDESAAGNMSLSERIDVMPSSKISKDVSSEVMSFKVEPRPMARPKSSWAFESLDINEHGQPVLSFSNGLSVSITDQILIDGVLKIGPHNLQVKTINGGVEILIDGMRMYLPKAA